MSSSVRYASERRFSAVETHEFIASADSLMFFEITRAQAVLKKKSPGVVRLKSNTVLP